MSPDQEGCEFSPIIIRGSSDSGCLSFAESVRSRDDTYLVKTPAVLRFRSTIKLIWLSIRLVCIKADGPTTFSRPHWIVVKAGRTSCIRAGARVIVFIVRVCTSRCVSSQPVASRSWTTRIRSRVDRRVRTCVHACVRTLPLSRFSPKSRGENGRVRCSVYRLLSRVNYGPISLTTARYLSSRAGRIISRCNARNHLNANWHSFGVAL